MSKILSVSIAAYQVEDTIKKCLDSFLSSKYLSELELLVINDGSKDNTEEIVMEYEKRYPSVVRLVNKKNGGHGSTINKSLELATGKYYKVLDGDDWCDVNELDKLMELLQKTSAELIVNRYREVYPSHFRVIGKDVNYELNKVYDFSSIFDSNDTEYDLIAMHEITILTERLRAVKTQIQEHCFYADTEFIYYVGLAARTVTFHDSCAYQYRLGTEGQSVSSAGVYRHIEDLFRIERKLINKYSEDCLMDIEVERKKYLFTIISKTYNVLFNWYVSLIDKPDKDDLLIDFISELRRTHGDLVYQFKLTKINRIIAIYPTMLIPVIRWIKQGIIGKCLVLCKKFIKRIKSCPDVV